MKKVAVLCLTLLSFFAKAQNLDLKVLENINTYSNTNHSNYWINTTKTTYPIVAGIQLGMILDDYSSSDSLRKRIPILIAEKVAVLAITDGLKYLVNRNRPYTQYPDLIHPYDNSEVGFSFPSGHTTLAFNTAAELSIKYPKWYIIVPSYLWASSIGYSRIYLGEHYPSDVIAGAALGVGCAYLEKWVNKKLFRKK